MIRINLLSPASIKKEERQEIMVLAYLLLFLLIIAGVTRLLFAYTAYISVQSKTAEIQLQLNKYEVIVKQVEALQATKSVLENKKNIIDTLMNFRLIYPYFFEDLVSTLTDNVWFKNIDTKLDPSGMLQVTIDADALNNYAIADFVTALSSNDKFSKVELGSITTSVIEKSTVSSFRVTFNHKRIKK
jgi:Tfp pilus assembly protein PilN